MTLFEMLFGLTAVILGLALTHIAASLQKLLYTGRRVRWAAGAGAADGDCPAGDRHGVDQPVVHGDVDTITTFQALLQVMKMLAVYFAAAGVLPELAGSDERVDLLEHYDRTRWLNYGALIVGLILFLTYSAIQFGDVPDTVGAVLGWLLIPAIYLSLIFVRWRPYNVAALIFVLLFYGYQVWPMELTG
jgi:hypothetical protein